MKPQEVDSPDYEMWYCPRYPVAAIRTPPNRPNLRMHTQHVRFREARKAQLAVMTKHIKTHGLINPLIILNHPNRPNFERRGGKYLRTGRNKFWCIKQLGWTTVPAIVTGECQYERVAVTQLNLQDYFHDGNVYYDVIGPRLRGATKVRDVPNIRIARKDT